MRFVTRHRRADDEAGVLPLINVVFLLLVFFMVAGRLAAPEPLAVTPPRSASDGRVSAETMLLLVDREGRLALDGRILDDAALAAALAAYGAQDGAPLLRLKADGAAEAVRVVEVLELLREAGIERLRLLTLPARPAGAL